LPVAYTEGSPQFEDELAPHIITRYREEKPVGLSRLFLLIEIAAIVGLAGILYLGFRGLRTINQNIEMTDNISATSEAELLSRLVQPTATPLISVNAVVLPGGHIWDASGRHSFNFTEVPAPYRAAFQEQVNAPSSTQPIFDITGAPRRIQIPAIGVDASIRTGDDWISLQAGVGHHPYSGLPGQKGNMVMTAHNDIYGEIFRDLQLLEPGDEIRIQSENGQWYTYRVDEKQVVEPSEVWVLGQDLGGATPLATLITCHPYRVDTHRMVVFAKLVN
ncbi:MAG: sortase, partial [Anaerolineae bacterium]|nr:sortase [Anaerolineae bacterium]